jgi:hypothetical protein
MQAPELLDRFSALVALLGYSIIRVIQERR